MLKKTSETDKLRTAPAILRIMATVGSVVGVSLALGACSGDGPPGGSEDSGTSGALEATPLELEEAPKGLKDRSDDAVIAILQEDPSYDSYVALLQASGVSEDLATADGMTVFAPVDEGIEKQADLLDGYLAPGDLESFLRDYGEGRLPEIEDRDGLATLLRRGIAEGELTPDRIRAGVRLNPFEGRPLVINVKGESTFVSGVEFDTKAGTFGSNGVVFPAGGLVAPAP